MPVITENKVGMYFVGNDEYAVFKANFAHTHKLVLGPYASDGVMRIAKYERLDLVFHYLLFEIGKIYRIPAVIVFKPAYDKPSAVV